MKGLKFIALTLAAIMVVGIFAACVQPSDEVKFSFRLSGEPIYFESRSKEYSLPKIEVNKDDVQFTYSWSVESGEEFVNLTSNDKFTVAPVEGEAILKAAINYDNVFDYQILTYKITTKVESFTSVPTDISTTQYANTDYTANGIAKRRVFGLYDFVYNDETESYNEVNSFDSFLVFTPGYVGNIELNVESSNESVAVATLDEDRVNVEFLSTGRATIKIVSAQPYAAGRYAYYSYTYDIVDAINCDTYSKIQALDEAAQQDIANARDIVLRSDIYTPSRATRFYGNVYGNGYKLDATEYAINHTNYPNGMRGETGDTSVNQAAFYMMSNDTTMDNAILIGDNRKKSNLNDYATGANGLNREFIGVAGIYGWWDSANTNRPENIVFKNTVFERGYRFCMISGANNPEKPIVFDNCVFRKSGDHGLSVASDEDTADPNNFEQAKEISCYVVLNNVIMYETRLPPVGILGSAGDDFGKAYGLEGSYKKACHVKLTGQNNYFFSWLKKSEIDYGTASVVGNTLRISDLIISTLSDKDNESFVGPVTSDEHGAPFSDPTNAALNPYINVVFFGNFGEANVVDVSESNYNGVLTNSGGQRWRLDKRGNALSSHVCSKIPDNTPNSGLHIPLYIDLNFVGGIHKLRVYVTLSLWMQYNSESATVEQGQNVFYPVFQAKEGNLEKCIAAMRPA